MGSTYCIAIRAGRQFLPDLQFPLHCGGELSVRFDERGGFAEAESRSFPGAGDYFELVTVQGPNETLLSVLGGEFLQHVGSKEGQVSRSGRWHLDDAETVLQGRGQGFD